MHASLLSGPVGQARSLRHPRDVPGSCSYAARPQLSSRLLARQRHRAVRVSAAAKSLYDVLGVSEAANERDIKRAYRQKALKLHPDVNKAPNAETQFLEVKNAFTVLSDRQQRADYDRKLRGGFGGSWGSSAGFGDYGSWGSSAGTSSSSGSRPRPKQQEEEFYGLGDLLNEVGSGVGQWVQQQAEELSKLQQGAADVLGGVVQKAGDSIKSGKLEDFFNDLEKEVSAWSKQRAESGKPASLWEELSAIGEEFVDFLEQGLGDEYKSSSSSSSQERGKGGSSVGGSTEFNHSSKARTPVDKFEDLKRRYDLYDESFKKGTAGSTSSSSSSSTNGTGRTSAASSGGGGSSGGARSSSTGSAQAKPPPTPQKTRDEEVEDELAALKRKLGKQ